MERHANFDIDLDPARRLIRIAMRGFWNEGAVAEYDAAISRAADAMAAAGCPRPRLLALVDARQLSPQSGAVVEAYRNRLAHPGRHPRRLATLVGSALFKLQVMRLAIPNQRIFVSEAEALEWLLEDD